MSNAAMFVGTFLLILLALGTFRIAFGHWFCRYGMETLMLAAAVFMAQASLRLAESFDLITPTTSWLLASLLYLIAVAILAQIAYAHWLWHRVTGPHERGAA
jgi:flagellar biosynthesis protein FliR